MLLESVGDSECACDEHSRVFWRPAHHDAVELHQRGDRVVFVDSPGFKHPSAQMSNTLVFLKCRFAPGLQSPAVIGDETHEPCPLVVSARELYGELGIC